MFPARISRRQFVSGSAVAVVGGVSASIFVYDATAAQGSPVTSTSELGAYGFPTIDITVTSTGYEGIPDELAAGRYLVTVTPSDKIDYGIGVGFVQPSGMSAADFLAAMMGAPAAGSPEAGDAVASPAAGGPFDVLIGATFAGGAHSLTGDPVQVVMDFPPGEWIAWAFEPEASQQPVVFTVSGEMPADLAEPDASATLTMAEYSFNVSQGAPRTGPQVVRVENVGAEPHFLDLYKGPDDVTEERVATVLDEQAQAAMTGTPPAYSDLDPDVDFTEVFTTTTQSTGVTNWFSLDLEPGLYVALCFFPDAQGVPHAMHGMYAVFDVE